MDRGELGGWHPPAAAVRADLVVVLPSLGDRCSGQRQRFEPVVIQAFVSELAVEALDAAVLHRSARLDQEVSNSVELRLSHEPLLANSGPLLMQTTSG